MSVSALDRPGSADLHGALRRQAGPEFEPLKDHSQGSSASRRSSRLPLGRPRESEDDIGDGKARMTAPVAIAGKQGSVSRTVGQQLPKGRAGTHLRGSLSEAWPAVVVVVLVDVVPVADI